MSIANCQSPGAREDCVAHDTAHAIRLLGPRNLRRGAGKGFEYRDDDGRQASPTRRTLERIRELGIPPAWKDVWICPYPRGHLQATGIDARRAQAVPLPRARGASRRDAEKFDDMVRFARALPDAARARRRRSRRRGLTRERVLACAVRLLDRGFFRIGSEEYAVAERVLRPGHDAQGARDDRARTARWSSTTPPRAGSAACRRSSTRGAATSCAALSAAAAAATSCSRTRTAAAGATCARRTSTRTSRRPPATTSRPRTSAPGTRPSWPPWRCRCPARWRASKTGAQARGHARDQGGRALPRQHAGGLPRLLHRPARVRRLPRRSHHRQPAASSRPRSTRASCRSTSARSRRRCST